METSKPSGEFVRRPSSWPVWILLLALLGVAAWGLITRANWEVDVKPVDSVRFLRKPSWTSSNITADRKKLHEAWEQAYAEAHAADDAYREAQRLGSEPPRPPRIAPDVEAAREALVRAIEKCQAAERAYRNESR